VVWVVKCRNPNRHPPRRHLTETTRPLGADIRQPPVHSHSRRALNPRNSIVDVVQSVGRVMRKAPGKDYGYVILPVAVPEGVEPSVALVSNALRFHPMSSNEPLRAKCWAIKEWAHASL
jgi:hypothetical protein